MAKIGSGHLAAMGRLGLAELRQAASLGQGSVEAATPYGIVGNVTPGEISQSRGVYGPNAEQEAPQRNVSLASLREQGQQQQSQQMQRQHGRSL